MQHFFSSQSSEHRLIWNLKLEYTSSSPDEHANAATAIVVARNTEDVAGDVRKVVAGKTQPPPPACMWRRGSRIQGYSLPNALSDSQLPACDYEVCGPTTDSTKIVLVVKSGTDSGKFVVVESQYLNRVPKGPRPPGVPKRQYKLPPPPPVKSKS